jgi:hypothetical protein
MSTVVAFLLRAEMALDDPDVGTPERVVELVRDLKSVLLASSSFDDVSVLVRVGSRSDRFRPVYDRLCQDAEIMAHLIDLGIQGGQLDPDTARLFFSQEPG